jgi:hypothetical protein
MMTEIFWSKPTGILEIVTCYSNLNLTVFSSKFENPFIKSHCSAGYVFKVLNSQDSKNPDFIEAQSELLVYLSKIVDSTFLDPFTNQSFDPPGNKGVTCPAPLKNLNGQYYSLEDCDGQKNIIRLFEFIPGKIFYEVPATPDLISQAGEYIGKIDNYLKVHLGSQLHWP